MAVSRNVKDYIRTIPDFPHKGIMFRDVTTLFADPRGFRIAIDQLLHPYAGEEIDKVVGLEARGFILGGAIAHQLSVGFVPIRKKGKLPGKTIEQPYQLEYGEAVMEMHDDVIGAGEKILLVDDLLATGGTAEAGINVCAVYVPLIWCLPSIFSLLDMFSIGALGGCYGGWKLTCGSAGDC